MSEKTLFKTFVTDSRNFINTINHIMHQLQSNPGNTELILQAYRNAHSLKSEAAFLKEEEVVGISHSMETIFEKYKKPGTFITKPDNDRLFFSLDRINEILDYYSETALELHQENKVHTYNDENVNDIDVMSLPSLTTFEKVLLQEAKDRRENLYRLTFEISEECPMKYAKAFLVISKLEAVVNVIRTVPSFGNEDETLYKKMSIYFSTSVPEKEIYHAVNIDQVTSISLTSLSFEMLLKNSFLDKIRKHNNSSIRVDNKKLDQISNYLDEIKIDIHRLMKNLDRVDKQNIIGKYVERINKYSHDIENVVKEIEMISLTEVFSIYTHYITEFARKLNKQVHLEIKGSDLKVSRRAGEIISEIVSHLIRNAVDHGIETVKERAASGKNPSGRILIKVKQEDDILKIIVDDDGRGIDREEIALKLAGRAVDLTKDDNLLKVLMQEGNSTKETPDTTSGRGIGLNIVVNKLNQLQGGKLLLESTLHEGTRFTIIIPGGFTLTSFQLVRSGNRIIAIPSRNVQKIIDISTENYTTGSDGVLLLDSVPVYSVEGKILATDTKPLESKGVFIGYPGKQGIFLIDEILFEKSLSENDLTLVIEDNPYLYKVLFGGMEAEYLYLNPAIVAE